MDSVPTCICCGDSSGEMAFLFGYNRHASTLDCITVLRRALDSEREAAGELFAVIARIGETLGIPMSTPYLCREIEARVADLVGAPSPIAPVTWLYTGSVVCLNPIRFIT